LKPSLLMNPRISIAANIGPNIARAEPLGIL
jgi:hypothetical protein